MNHRHLDLPMFMGAGLSFVTFFSKSFSAIYFWKKYLLVTPNLLSSALEMILTFFMNDRIFFFVFWFGRRTWLLACRRGIFFVFPLFFFDFFFFPIYGVSTASGLGWTVSTEITTFVLLDDPSKSVFLSVISSSASAFVFYIGASITKIINGPSLIFFFVMFLTWHN